MSYSRWSNSYWYTFHSAYSAPFDRDKQIFEICNVIKFTWRQLVNARSACLEIVKDLCKEIYQPDRQPSEKDIKELEGYMIEFISDISLDFAKFDLFVERFSEKLDNILHNKDETDGWLVLDEQELRQLKLIIDDLKQISSMREFYDTTS